MGDTGPTWFAGFGAALNTWCFYMANEDFSQMHQTGPVILLKSCGFPFSLEP